VKTDDQRTDKGHVKPSKVPSATRMDLLVFLLCCICSCSCLASPLLAGDWKLNRQLSDDVEKTWDSQRKKEKRADRYRRRSQSQRGYRSRPGGRRGVAAGMGLAFRRFLPRSNLLTIELRAQAIDLRYADGNTRLIDLSPQGQAVSAKGKPGEVERTVVIAGWEDGRLYVENTTEQNVKIHEVYYLNAGGVRLIVETEMTAPGSEAVKTRRVFDRIVRIN